MREYNVALNKDVDYDEFWNDMESDTDGGKLYIPNRAVEFTNERPASLRQCWYLLTDEEAELLRQDDRVLCVEIPPEYRDDIVIGHRTTQKSDFTKTTSDSGAYINWGLIRSNFPTNVFGAGTSPTINANYDYTLTGAGVDVVIQDSGIQVDHPEFQDSYGNSRVQQVNWGTLSGLGFTQNANHYRDFDGHGTHVAGIVAGKTYGFAKDSKIYSLKVSGLEGSGDSGTGISVTYCFDAIKIFHRDKAINPNTGCKRPTVVNMSWGYGHYYSSISWMYHQGTTYSSASAADELFRYTNLGLPNTSGAPSTTYSTNTRVGSVDTDVEELIDAGVVVCIAAGNRSHKIDVSTGVDYNNYIVSNTSSSGSVYYHRGSSPYSTRAFMVGSLDSSTFDADLDQKATYSETGPGVNIYAPGTNIMSATSNTNSWGAGSQNYYLNASYKQTNISGTSMAAPQVCGVAALFLQNNPTASVAQIKSSILDRAQIAAYTGSNSSSYNNTRALHGSIPRVLYNPYGGTNQLQFSGSLKISANINFINF
jgi:subtilisin family serine protease